MPLLFFDVPKLRSPIVPPFRFKTFGFFIVQILPFPTLHSADEVLDPFNPAILRARKNPENNDNIISTLTLSKQ